MEDYKETTSIESSKVSDQGKKVSGQGTAMIEKPVADQAKKVQTAGLGTASPAA
ncbi:hypothetical protein GMMP15_1550006 [Candidatus Magnetomoraceae bacterium gMMP-15]